MRAFFPLSLCDAVIVFSLSAPPILCLSPPFIAVTRISSGFIQYTYSAVFTTPTISPDLPFTVSILLRQSTPPFPHPTKLRDISRICLYLSLLSIYQNEMCLLKPKTFLYIYQCLYLLQRMYCVCCYICTSFMYYDAIP